MLFSGVLQFSFFQSLNVVYSKGMCMQQVASSAAWYVKLSRTQNYTLLLHNH